MIVAHMHETNCDDDPTLEEPIDAVRAWREARLRNTTPRPTFYQPPPDDRPTVPPCAAVSGDEGADDAARLVVADQPDADVADVVSAAVQQ